MNRRLPSTVLVAIAVLACTGTPTAPNGSSLVIQAFLYAAEPVTDVRLTLSVPLGGSDTVGAPVNDASVALSKNGVRYTLTRSAGDSGYYHYAGSDLTVAEGDVFDLAVTHAGTVATAQTIVPTRPEPISLSADSVVIPTLGGGFGGGPPTLATPLVVRWPNPAGDLFFVTVDATDSDATPISGRPGGLRRFIFAPIVADSFTVSPLTLAYYGPHQLRVYHVNTEYAALYESRQQDSRDLNEPATNIRNGLGVFSAFSSRAATFRAVAGGS